MYNKDSEINEWLSSLNKYIKEYGNGDTFCPLNVDLIKEDVELLDKLTDFVVSLIFKIGIDENCQPNIHGVLLDSCLEKLNDLRENINNRENAI